MSNINLYDFIDEIQDFPKKGILFFLAKLIAAIFPSVPLFPKPPGIRIPETFFSNLFTSFGFKLSDSILNKFTFTFIC